MECKKMRFLIAAVGRAKAGPERTLFEYYQARVQAPFSLHLKEVEEKRAIQGAQLKQREATLLQGCVTDGAIVIALDEKEKSLSSKEFAEKIGDWRDRGIRDLVFMIGGADGLGEVIRKQARQTMSFGAQTWPHMLVRGLLAEQLYRAQCILGGHPYHRE
jgi:23S rRNA (pseudouridine1915-N3)-methyltransferase